MKRLLASLVLLSAFGLILNGCDEVATDPANPASGTVTFNITVPFFNETTGAPVQASIWDSFEDISPVATQSGTISGSTLTLQIADVDTGVYIMAIAIDMAGDGYGAGPADDGDLLWGAIDVVVDGDETITVSQYGWSYIDSHVLVFGIRGIPAGNHGAIIGLGIFPDGADVYQDTVETIYGGAGLVYGTSALVIASADLGPEDTTGFELPTGNYDVYALLDLDGSVIDWFDLNDGGPAGNPITNGDFLASYNLAFDATAGIEDFLVTLTFEEVQAYTLTFNITAPDSGYFEGNEVMAVLFSDFQQDEPITFDTTVVSGGTAVTTMTVLTNGNYSMGVLIDGAGDGFGSFGDSLGPNIEMGDLVWGAVNIPITGDMAITIGADSWQFYHSMMLVVDNVPAGHSGQIFAAAMLPRDGNPLDPYIQAEMVGAGIIYQNSAFIALGPQVGWDTPGWELPMGDYDIWCLIDVDGVPADYDRPDGDSSAFNPSTIGDWYMKYQYTFDTTIAGYDDFINAEGTFNQLVGITGTVSCSTWAATGGNIFLYLFEQNPILADSADAYSYTEIEAPGTYGLPCFPGDSVVVVGFWDVDNSGEWDGPTHGIDVIGGWGTAMDSLHYVTCLSTGVANINFELDTVYDSTAYGP